MKAEQSNQSWPDAVKYRSRMTFAAPRLGCTAPCRESEPAESVKRNAESRDGVNAWFTEYKDVVGRDVHVKGLITNVGHVVVQMGPGKVRCIPGHWADHITL